MRKGSVIFLFSVIVAIIGLIGCSGATSGGAGGGDTTAPAEIVVLTQVAGDGEITITWTDPDDADFDNIDVTYGIYGSGSTQTDTRSPGDTAWTGTSLSNDVPYEVLIQTKDSTGNTSTGIKLTLKPTAAGADTDAPSVVATTPADGTDGVATDATISIKFSEAMNEASVSNPGNYSITSNFAGSDPALESEPTIEWVSATNTATITFAAALSADTTYTGIVSTSITDLAGNALSGIVSERTMGFTTVDAGTVATPAFSLPEGTYTADLSLEITCSTPGATIYYIEVSGTPAATDTEYSGPITVTQADSPYTISAVAIADGLTNSAIVETTYTVDYPQAYAPTIIPASEAFTTDQTIDLDFTSPDEGVSYWFGADYSDESKTDIAIMEYDPLSPPVLTLDIDGEAILVMAEARGDGFETSDPNLTIYSLAYETATAPTFSPAGGTVGSQTEFTISQEIVLSSTTPGAVIYYTTDDSTPDMDSDSIASGESITIDDDAILQAFAVADQYKDSAISGPAYYDLVPSILGSLTTGGASGMDVAVFLVADDTDFDNPGAWVNAQTYDNASGSVDFVVPMPDGDYYLCAAASDDLASFPSDGDFFGYFASGAAAIPSLNDFDQSGSDIPDFDFALMDDFYLAGDYYAFDGMAGEEARYESGLLDITMTVDSITDPRVVNFSIIAWDDSEQWVILKEEGTSEYEIYGWIPGSPAVTFISYADSTVGDGASQFATAQLAYNIIGHANEDTETWPIYSDVNDIPQATAPAFDPPSGTVFVGTGPHNITIGSSDGEYMIFTTTDGSDPTLASNTFPSGDFYEVTDVDGITETTTIHAARAGLSERLSDVVSASYEVYDYSITGTIDVPAGAGSNAVYLYVDIDTDFSNGNETAYSLGVMSAGDDQPFTLYYNSGEFGAPAYYIWAAAATDSVSLPESGEYFGTYSTSYPEPASVALSASVSDIDISLQEAIDTGMQGTWYTATPDGEFTSTWELLDIANQGTGFGDSSDSSLDIIAWDNSANWVIVKDSDPTNTEPFEIWGWANATPATVDIVLNESSYTSTALAYADLASLDYGNPTFTVYASLAAVPRADTPTFSIESGVVAEGVSLTISSSAGSTIYFTVDGATDPSFSASGMQDMATGSSITISEDVEIRAVAFGPDKRMSAVATASYSTATNSVSGTLTLPGTSDVTIFLDDNDDFRDGWLDAFTISDASTDTEYTLYTDYAAGTYYVCAATWDSQAIGPDDETDWFGVYSTSPTGVGTGVNLGVLNQSDINITLKAGPDNIGTWFGNYFGSLVTLNISLLDFEVLFEEVAGNDDIYGHHVAWDNDADWHEYQYDDDSGYEKWGWTEITAVTHGFQYGLLIYGGDEGIDWDDPEDVAGMTESSELLLVYSSLADMPANNDAGYSGGNGGTLSLTIDYSAVAKASSVDNLIILLLNEDDLSSENGPDTFRASDSVTVSGGTSESYTFVNCDPTESYFVMVMANSGQLELGSGYGAADFDPPTGFSVAIGGTSNGTVIVTDETSGEYSGGDAVTLSGTVDFDGLSGADVYDFMEVYLEDYDSGEELVYVIDISGEDALSFTFTNLDPNGNWTIAYTISDYSWDNEIRRNSESIDLSSGGVTQTKNLVLLDPNDGGYPGENALSGTVTLDNLSSTAGIEVIYVSLNDNNGEAYLEFEIDYFGGAPYTYDFVNLDPAGDWYIQARAIDDDWNELGFTSDFIGDVTAPGADVKNLSMDPPSFDGSYTSADAATLSGVVDYTAAIGSVDNIEVTLDDGEGMTLTDTFWVEHDSPSYEFVWLDPSKSWTISVIARNDSWVEIDSISAAAVTVTASQVNTQDLTF